MKASLEPKEQQIENLKEQLLELEQVFEKQSKALLGLEEHVCEVQLILGAFAELMVSSPLTAAP
jgi:flagellar motility protein MotE (MotC chaperone)